MKIFHGLSKVISTIAIPIIIFSLTACSSPKDPKSQQLNAINDIRESLKLPKSPLEFVEITADGNSPSGDLQVAIYQDSEGRKYSVSQETNQVVEIDARAILENISPDTPALSPDELKAKAMNYVKATVSNFDSLQSSWQYEEGAKIGTYFYNWYGKQAPGSMNRPRIQICLHQSGLLFCYYNTLTLKK